MQKSADAFRTISEVAEDLSLPQHVLRFWETRFPQIRPLKRAGGRRYYRPADVLLLRTIRQLLYDDGYTIKGVQRLIKEQGAKGLGGASAEELKRFGVLDFEATGPDLQHDDEHDAPCAAAGPSPAPEPTPSPAYAPPRPREIAGLADALAVVEECRRILEALRRP